MSNKGDLRRPNRFVISADSGALKRIANLAQLSTGSDIALVCVFDKFRAGAGLHDELNNEELELVLTLCSRSVRHHELLQIQDLRNTVETPAGGWEKTMPSLGSFCGAPIWVSGVRIGTVVVVSNDKRRLDDYETAMLTNLAQLAADQIDSARALESAQGKHFRAQQIFQEISDGVITVNEFGHIRRINRAAENIFGHNADDIKGQRITLNSQQGLVLVSSPGEKRGRLPNLKSLVGERHTIGGRHADGRALALDMTVAEVELQDELAYVLTVRDTTELHAAQMLLSQHSFIVEKTESAVLVTDSSQRIEWCNPGFETISGYTLAEIRGQCAVKLLWSEDTSKPVRKRVQSAIGEKHSYNAEMIWLRKGGQPFWIALDAHPICDVNGELVKYVALGFDITERKRSAQMKSDFVSMVSHELRTPLTVISGTIEAMADGIAGPMPELADELLTMAMRNCTSLATLIEDLLDINQLEAGVVKLNSRRFSIKELMEEVKQSMHSIAEEARVALRLEHCDDEPMVFSDRDRLNQVVTNLMSNAIKFSPPDTTVTLRCTTQNDTVSISVTDQGPGITHEFRPKLFEMFARDPAVEASGKEGFGLGLCISKGLMDRMGGEIGFESSEDGGARFCVSLPLLGSQPPTGTPTHQNVTDDLLESGQA
ncbi:MAG: PAS domain S-box protein [Burkholderiaceae bacterium]